MDKKSGLIITLIIVVFMALSFVQAEETNTTEPESNESIVENTTIEENATIVFSIEETNETETNETITENITDFKITSFTPKEFKTNTEIQFNIQIENIGNTELKDLTAFVSGRGFSSSDVTQIDLLRPNEKSYIIVMGTFYQQGEIELTIRINDKEFKQGVQVITPNSAAAVKLEEDETQKEAELQNLSLKLQELKTNFSALEKEYKEKKDNKYDMSEIELSDLKKFLRDAESSLIVKDLEQAKISTTLGADEYFSLEEKIENADKIKVPILDIIKNNVIILSTIAASIITLFSFYELMKKKKAAVVETVSENIKSIKDKKKDSEEKEETTKEDSKKKKN